MSQTDMREIGAVARQATVPKGATVTDIKPSGEGYVVEYTVPGRERRFYPEEAGLRAFHHAEREQERVGWVKEAQRIRPSELGILRVQLREWAAESYSIRQMQEYLAQVRSEPIEKYEGMPKEQLAAEYRYYSGQLEPVTLEDLFTMAGIVTMAYGYAQLGRIYVLPKLKAAASALWKSSSAEMFLIRHSERYAAHAAKELAPQIVSEKAFEPIGVSLGQMKAAEASWELAATPRTSLLITYRSPELVKAVAPVTTLASSSQMLPLLFVRGTFVEIYEPPLSVKGTVPAKDFPQYRSPQQYDVGAFQKYTLQMPAQSQLAFTRGRTVSMAQYLEKIAPVAKTVTKPMKPVIPIVFPQREVTQLVHKLPTQTETQKQEVKTVQIVMPSQPKETLAEQSQPTQESWYESFWKWAGLAYYPKTTQKQWSELGAKPLAYPSEAGKLREELVPKGLQRSALHLRQRQQPEALEGLASQLASELVQQTKQLQRQAQKQKGIYRQPLTVQSYSFDDFLPKRRKRRKGEKDFGLFGRYPRRYPVATAKQFLELTMGK